MGFLLWRIIYIRLSKIYFKRSSITHKNWVSKRRKLPEYVFVEHIYIDKFNDLKFKKYGFDNFEVDKLKTGKCKFKVFENPLSTK